MVTVGSQQHLGRHAEKADHLICKCVGIFLNLATVPEQRLRRILDLTSARPGVCLPFGLEAIFSTGTLTAPGADLMTVTPSRRQP
jgi:hypothetical protein